MEKKEFIMRMLNTVGDEMGTLEYKNRSAKVMKVGFGPVSGYFLLWKDETGEDFAVEQVSAPLLAMYTYPHAFQN